MASINLNGINELDVTSSGGVTATLTSPGVVALDIAAGGAGIDLQTNGTDNGSQTKLNLVAGTNITLSDDGTGDVTITSATGSNPAHFVSSGPTPTIQSITNLGAGATVNITGTDTAGIIVVIAGTSPGTGSVVVQFAAAYASAPIVVVSPNGSVAALDNAVHTEASTTVWSLTFDRAPAGGGAGYSFNYHVIG